MPRKRAPKVRSYLARDDRRQALLDTAAAVVEEQGWPALSMITVAERAGVSRQLVYGHFTSPDELMAETMTHIFRGAYETVRGSIQGGSGTVADFARLSENVVFDLPPGRIRALWQMITGSHSTSAETRRMARRLRHLLTNLWMPVMNEVFGLPERESRVLVWMLHMAFWGAHQLVEDGETDRDTAIRLFIWMMNHIQAGSVISPPSKPTAARAVKA